MRTHRTALFCGSVGGLNYENLRKDLRHSGCGSVNSDAVVARGRNISKIPHTDHGSIYLVFDLCHCSVNNTS